MKNLLATVQALAAQTMRSGIRDPEEFASAFSARLRAMSRAQDLLTAEDLTAVESAAQGVDVPITRLGVAGGDRLKVKDLLGHTRVTVRPVLVVVAPISWMMT